MANKYSSTYRDVYSLFSSDNWAAEDIKTFPDNFVGQVAGDEYIRVSVIFGSSTPNVRNSIKGVLNIDVFIPSGAGPTRSVAIADTLDSYLANKSFNTTVEGTTQFYNSTLEARGVEKSNPALYRSLYTIPFNYYGK